MAIAKGNSVPSVTVFTMTPDGPKSLSTDDIFKGKKVVLFAVPGAFTPTCTARHLPGFVEKAADIRAKGVDDIVCVAVNDPFVMQAWGDAGKADGKVTMISDGNGDLTKALGLELDARKNGLGTRSQRFALIADDGKVTDLFVEERGAFEVSTADNILKHL